MDKKFNYQDQEKHWQKYWQENEIYKFDPKKEGEIFSVDTPPPYVSASHLHMGHAMSYVQAEIIVRYQRMQGKNVFYPMGFDDNGLPTERFVEKKYKVNKDKITKKEFVDLCKKETQIGGETYKELWTKLGISVDWSLLYNTINILPQKVAQRSFLDLYRKAKLERKNAPVFWCTHCHMSLAQADLEDREEKGWMYDIEFKGENGEPLVISTTRPELIPACVALYVNPNDERYQNLIGKKAIVPILEYEVPIKTSEAVEIEKGTGLMMVCTFGDTEDIEKWKLDNLDTRLIINEKGIVNKLAGPYEGLKLVNLRKKIIEDLEEKGLLKAKNEIEHSVNVHERCENPVDFFATDQWFIKLVEFKDEFLKRGEEIDWYPKFMKTRYDDWVNGLNWDWCISRNRFYGVPFPVWYCQDCGETILAKLADLPVDPREQKCSTEICPECNSKNIVGEQDVMDTWMTSSLTPLINAQWQEENNLMEEIYPMTLRIQAFEIIRTWLFYTVVKSHFHTGSLPWNKVMISGWGLDGKGKKMSKSKGNFVEPSSIIEKYGTDALRIWASNANLGTNLKYNEVEIKDGQKLVNKLWNAARFVESHLENVDLEVEITEGADQWILSCLKETIEQATRYLEVFEFHQARLILEKFFWQKFTDNYLEMVKDRLYNPEKRGDQAYKSAQKTLYLVLNSVVKLFAPYLPYVTEELYQIFFAKKEGEKSVHLSEWPNSLNFSVKNDLYKNSDLILEIISQIRKYKSDQGISLGAELESVIIELKDDNLSLENLAIDLRDVSRSKKLELSKVDKNKDFVESDKFLLQI